VNQSNRQLNQFHVKLGKWICRGIFVLLMAVMTYVASRDSYNFSHWVPHRWLRQIGVSYETILWGEQNADIAMHFFGAMILTLLIFGSKLFFFESRPLTVFLAVSILCLSAEGFQFMIGRGLESSDLLLGILGSFMAYWEINKKN
jgi:hypothetical protein